MPMYQCLSWYLLSCQRDASCLVVPRQTLCWDSATTPVIKLKFSNSIRGDGQFTPIIGLAGVANIAWLKWSVSALRGGSDVSLKHGPPPVWRQKSQIIIKLFCISQEGTSNQIWGAAKCINFTCVLCVFRIFPFNSSFWPYLSCSLQTINMAHIWQSFGESSMIWHWIGHIWYLLLSKAGIPSQFHMIEMSSSPN